MDEFSNTNVVPGVKYAIINADDFGLSKGVNQGIIKAHSEGILTSATLMANMDGFQEAVELWKKNRTLGVGVHLNLLRGKPVLPEQEVRTLTVNGLFPGNISVIVKRLLSGKINLKEVEKELKAQAQKVIEAGIPITHFDSEKHLHCIPAFFRVAVKVADEFSIKRIRSIKERVISGGGIRNIKNLQFYKMTLLNFFCASMAKSLESKGMKVPNAFFGVLNSGGMDADQYRNIFKNLPGGVSEIMCHPGFREAPDSGALANAGKYYINESRQLELDALLSPSLKEEVDQLKIKLIHYGDLN